MSLSVLDYLRMAQGQTIPPLVLELLLKSGRSFFVKNIIQIDDEAGLLPIRVWDLRALSAEDIRTLQAKLSQVHDRAELNNFKALHPNLDQGNLWICVSEIEALTEWHDRFWPSIEEHQERRIQIGFKP